VVRAEGHLGWVGGGPGINSWREQFIFSMCQKNNNNNKRKRRINIKRESFAQSINRHSMRKDYLELS
jgi:hypothetical protein